MTSSHRVLMVGEERVVLYSPTENGLGHEASIAWAAPDFDRQLASAFDAKRAQHPTVVLLDEGSMTYRKEEDITPTDCIKRLEGAFPDFPVRASMEIPRGQKEGHSYLLVGLPESAHMSSLNRVLSGAHAHIAGCGVLPIESTGLVAVLAEKLFAGAGKKSRWALLAGQHETGGMRQVAIRDGVLALTRLIPPPAANLTAAGWADAMTRELAATMTYLSRFGYTEDQGIDAMIVCGDAEREILEKQALPFTHLRCLTLADAMRHLGCGISGQDGSNHADALHAAWAARAEALQMSIHMPFDATLKH